ncbi:MAG TPA: hypothetical protein VIO94_14730 [Phenylobacterium sp.]
MRWPLTLLILVGGLALSGLVWWASGGRVAFLFLPLLLGLPLLSRRRR